jgi:glycosyltransferase involved in cell wall biosynthesis
MEQKRLQILISAVNKDPEELIGSMNLDCDAVIVNQIIDDSDGEAKKDDNNDYIKPFDDYEARIIVRREKGVGLSRNTALEASDHELIQFGDDDIVYDDGYASKVIAEFDAHPEADMLLLMSRPRREERPIGTRILPGLTGVIMEDILPTPSVQEGTSS